MKGDSKGVMIKFSEIAKPRWSVVGGCHLIVIEELRISGGIVIMIVRCRTKIKKREKVRERERERERERKRERG